MDISIQHPWFRRALGPAYPARLFDQFFGEGLFDHDILPYAASTISPYYRQSLFRNFWDFSNSGVSEVTRKHRVTAHFPFQNSILFPDCTASEYSNDMLQY